MPAKNYLRILRVGVIASLLIFFFVFQGFLFPYITSKQLSFNILMEALLVFWAILMIKYPAYRPRRSWITLGLLVYMLVIAASCLTSVNFVISFWGNAERMLGFFHLFHFFLLYLYIITAFRKREDWQWLFGSSLVAAAAIVIYGLSTNYPPSTIGNAAYVAGLMIFNFYFGLWLFFSFKNWGLRLLTIPLIVLVLVGFVKADISGAQAGLGISLIALLFLAAVLAKSRWIKVAGSLAALALIGGIVAMFIFRQAPIFDNNFIGKSLRDFSSSNPTLNTRLISWQAAASYLKDNPRSLWLGIGFGNYSVIFDKYFDPKFYNYTRTETYFDRAHNNLIDIVSTTGVIGLLAYLSIFVAVIAYLRRAWKEERLSHMDASLIGALLIGYFVQNLAVFDSLVTYVSLMFVLGYVYFCAQPEDGEMDETPAITPERERLWGALLGVVMIVAIYIFNGRAIMMFKVTIQAYMALGNGQAEEGQILFKQAFDYNSGLERDSRVYFINMLLSYPSLLQDESGNVNKELIDYAVNQADINLTYNGRDSFLQTQLAQLFYTASRLYYHDQQELANYSSWGLEAINIAIEGSPRRVPLYFIKSDILLIRGETDEALKNIEYAISLNPDYPDGYCQLAETRYYMKDYDAAYSQLIECLNHGGRRLPRSVALIEDAIAARGTSSPEINIKLHESLADVKQDAASYAELAKLYAQSGNKEGAINAAHDAARVDPSLSANVEEFVKSVEAQK